MEGRDPALAGRTRRIPRPWLYRHHPPNNPHMPQYPPPNPYLYPPPGAMPGHPLGAPPNPTIDILEKQEWKVSWDKLTCCFCLPGPHRTRKLDAHDHRHHDYGLYGGRRAHHHDPVPFPRFPILRRNSSSSFLSHENDVNEVSAWMFCVVTSFSKVSSLSSAMTKIYQIIEWLRF